MTYSKANKVDDRLCFALIQQLAYSNVTLVDQYLPGIQAIPSGAASPVEASRAIESPETHFRPEIQAAIQA